ncbi:MAG: nucleotidyltransferase domain-containing protein [Planctomycetota bacterium]
MKTALRETRRRPVGKIVSAAGIRRCVNCLLENAPAGSQIILFGSYALGKPKPGSDLDFMVIEPEVTDRLGEMVRLRTALDTVIAPLLVAADVVVASRRRFEEWRDTPNTIYREAARKGRVYDAIG